MTARVATTAIHPRTFYEILQVSRLASSEEIRASYLSLAKRYHPDTAASSALSDTSTNFREVQEAYGTLSNSWKRTLYDQDLQFGAALTSPSWIENFEKESSEDRIARRQRYLRYAKGERLDEPPQQLTTRGSLLGLVFGGSVLTYVCAKAPEWFGGQGDLTFHDPVVDDRSVPLVDAFFNPITRKWERLAAGQYAPSFVQLTGQYGKYFPKLIEKWEYTQKQNGNDPSHIETLTVARVPKTATVPASVYLDANNAVKIHRKSISEQVVNFINPR